MNAISFLVTCVACVVVTTVHQTIPEFQSLPVEARRTAMEAIALAIGRHESFDVAVLPRVEVALRDADVTVRRGAFAVVGLLSKMTYVARQRRPPIRSLRRWLRRLKTSFAPA